MNGSYKRVNVMIGEEQYQALNVRGLNISGLIRDLLGDYLGENVVNLQVSEQTRKIYDLVVANAGSSDQELEKYLRRALARVLDDNLEEMKKLHETLKAEARERNPR